MSRRCERLGSEERAMDKKFDKKGDRGGKPGLGGDKGMGGKTAGTPPPGMSAGGGKQAKPFGDKGKGKF